MTGASLLDWLDWLERLHRLGLVHLTPSQVEACVRLTATEGVWRRQEDLADALASVLAGDPRTYQVVREDFLSAVRGRADPAKGAETVVEEGFAEMPDPPIEVPASGIYRPVGSGRFLQWFARMGGRGSWIAVLIGLAIVVGVAKGPSVVLAIVEYFEIEVIPKPKPKPPVSTARAQIDLIASSIETSIEASASQVNQPSPEDNTLPGPAWLRWLLLISSPLTALLAGRWWRASTELRRDLERVEAEASSARDAAQHGGRASGAPYNIRRELALDRGRVDDAATILGRRRDEALGDELDVRRTLAHTIDAGGRFSPIFAPSERRAILLVFVDREQGGHPFLHGVDLLLERWRACGLVFDRYDFDFSPLELTDAAGKRVLSLDALARQSEGRPLLIFSRFRRSEKYRSGITWPSRLGAWPARAWIDLDPHTLSEHDDEGRRLRERIADLPRYAFTADGLLRAARCVASGEAVEPGAEEALPSVASLEEDLWKWAACAALVPDPTWPQLEAVRRELEPLRNALPDPRYVQRLIEWAACEGMAYGKSYLLGTGPRLAFNSKERRRLMARLREHDCRHAGKAEERLEWRARELLCEQLEAAVSESPFGEALRLAKISFHRAVMNPMDARELLAGHDRGAAARELKRLVVEELTLQAKGTPSTERWESGLARGLTEWTKPGFGARLSDLLALRGWSFGLLWRALPWSVLAGLGALCWWGQLSGRWDLMPESVMSAMRGSGEVGPAPLGARVVRSPAVWRVRRIIEGDPELVALADVAPLRLVRLPGGEFMMGSPESEDDHQNDERLHRARVGAFAIGIHEVTLAQWQAVMKTRPNNCKYGCDKEHPVSNVSWNDACRFTIALTERENAGRQERGAELLTPCYRAEGDSCVWPKAQRECTGFRLPTEAEWEYAARADSKTAYFFGDDRTKLCTYGNVRDKSRGNEGAPCDDGYAGLAPVGSFEASPWGLYDVHGNVLEWVWDWYGEYPEKSGAVRSGYSGPDDGKSRVLRGGSFRYVPWRLRAADRGGGQPSNRLPFIGFRVLRVAPVLEP